MESASYVCGKRYVGGGIRRGSEWWNEEVKRKVDEKKRAVAEWLQCGSRVKYERYKILNVEVKRKVNDAKEAANLNSRAFSSVRCNTSQFSRSFIPSVTRLWNELPSPVVESLELQRFKLGSNAFLLDRLT